MTCREGPVVRIMPTLSKITDRAGSIVIKSAEVVKSTEFMNSADRQSGYESIAMRNGYGFFINRRAKLDSGYRTPFR